LIEHRDKEKGKREMIDNKEKERMEENEDKREIELRLGWCSGQRAFLLL